MVATLMAAALVYRQTLIDPPKFTLEGTVAPGQRQII